MISFFWDSSLGHNSLPGVRRIFQGYFYLMATIMFPPPWNVSWVSWSLAYFRYMTYFMPLEKSSWTLNVKWHFYHSPSPHSSFFLIALIFDMLHSFHLFVHCLLLQPECKFYEGRELFFSAIYPHRGIRCHMWYKEVAQEIMIECINRLSLFDPILLPHHSKDLNSLWRVIPSVLFFFFFSFYICSSFLMVFTKVATNEI